VSKTIQLPLGTLRYLCGAIALAVLAAAPLPAQAQAPVEEDMWPGIRKELYVQRTIAEEDGMVSLEAPVRAEDAAVVPITMRVPANISADAKELTLVIEKNPMPVAAIFKFGPAAGTGERVISTRVRVDMYSNIRAILETDIPVFPVVLRNRINCIDAAFAPKLSVAHQPTESRTGVTHDAARVVQGHRGGKHPQ